MALFRKFFYKKPPDGLLEITERVYGTLSAGSFSVNTLVLVELKSVGFLLSANISSSLCILSWWGVVVCKACFADSKCEQCWLLLNANISYLCIFVLAGGCAVRLALNI